MTLDGAPFSFAPATAQSGDLVKYFGVFAFAVLQAGLFVQSVSVIELLQQLLSVRRVEEIGTCTSCDN